MNLQWARDRRNAIHAADQSHVRRALAQRDRDGDDQNGAAEDTRGADTRNRATDDERRRVGRNTADEGADLEDEQRGEIHPLDGVEGVEFAVDELRRARGEQVRAAVPPDVIQGLELIRDAGDSRRDDGVVLACGSAYMGWGCRDGDV